MVGSRRATRLTWLVAPAAVLVLAWFALACGSSGLGTAPAAPNGTSPARSPAGASKTASTCGNGAELRVHFYDVGQALAALVELPDGRHVLVDAGDSATRAGCGETCARGSSHLLTSLARDLHGAPIDMLWVSHQHADHLGGVPAVLAQFPARLYVDNGKDAEHAEVRRARAAAEGAGAARVVIDPEHARVPLDAGGSVSLTAIVPRAWPARCKSDQNDCSIMLRIDYCASSILFAGDAEIDLEKVVDPGGPVTLLQVGHHGSNTSSSDAFLDKVAPRYAVISSGKPHEGLNAGYCHPRASTVRRLSARVHAAALAGGVGDGGERGEREGQRETSLTAYDRDDKCDDADLAAWVTVPTSANVLATARDGDVTLATKGDGVFLRR